MAPRRLFPQNFASVARLTPLPRREGCHQIRRPPNTRSHPEGGRFELRHVPSGLRCLMGYPDCVPLLNCSGEFSWARLSGSRGAHRYMLSARQPSDCLLRFICATLVCAAGAMLHDSDVVRNNWMGIHLRGAVSRRTAIGGRYFSPAMLNKYRATRPIRYKENAQGAISPGHSGQL